MKRTELKRRSSISRHVSIKAVNPEKKAKRRKRRPKVTKAMREAVLAKYGRQCAYVHRWEPGTTWVDAVVEFRCEVTEELEVHHEHYKQTPENPLDGLKLLCRYHHLLLESQLRPWNFR